MSQKPAVLITGAAIRVGAALARYFAKQGYSLALHYNTSKQEALQLKDELEQAGCECALFQADITQVSEIERLIESVAERFPQCGLLVNNASDFKRMDFMHTDEGLFDSQFTVNLKAPFFLTQLFAKRFKTGSVINIIDTDIARVEISHFAYLLSKKALADFTRMAAKALGPDMRVNAVCPGHMLPSSQVDEDYADRLKERLPLRGHASLEELAEAVRWLAGQEHITGEILFVDGGKHVI